MFLEIRIWRFIKRCWKNEDVVNFSDYGNTNGKHQEEEGFLLVKDFLSDSGMTQAQINRVAFLVGHHHTFLGIDGLDWQILIEADYIANATESGKRLVQSVFCLK